MKTFKNFCILALLFLLNSVGLAAPEVRRLAPPNLGEAHLGKKILCHRPMRHGAPRMEVEEGNGKVIVHNYGHGGSGWTLGPGCAQYAVTLLAKSPCAEALEADTPISILGAGALGLFTTYDLVKQGFKNLTIVAEAFEDLTSHKAGGLLAPVSMDNDPAMQAVIDQIGVDAYRFYASIAQKSNRDFPDGAVIVPAYFRSREDSGLEPYVGKVMAPAKDVILDFGTGTTQTMVAYDDGIFIDTAKMMTHLTSYLKNKGVKFIQKTLTSFQEVDTHYLFNCTGLGAAELSQDAEMESVQGHLILLKDQDPRGLQYMLLDYFGEGQTSCGQRVKRSFYIFPKVLAGSGPQDIGVIGGTFIQGATAETPNEEEFEILLQGAKNFYGIH